jgi:hypothetical protein
MGSEGARNQSWKFCIWVGGRWWVGGVDREKGEIQCYNRGKKQKGGKDGRTTRLATAEEVHGKLALAS